MARKRGTSLFQIYIPTILSVREAPYPFAAMYQGCYIGAPFPQIYNWMTPIILNWLVMMGCQSNHYDCMSLWFGQNANTYKDILIHDIIELPFIYPLH